MTELDAQDDSGRQQTQQPLFLSISVQLSYKQILLQKGKYLINFKANKLYGIWDYNSFAVFPQKKLSKTYFIKEGTCI